MFLPSQLFQNVNISINAMMEIMAKLLYALVVSCQIYFMYACPFDFMKTNKFNLL